ncbi:hypothetical protein ACWEQN_40665 [Streptomyces sp. NPDC004129]
MPPPPAELVRRVRHALKQAGFHVADGPDATTPGLKVSKTPEGVLVSWTTSHTFAELAAQRGDSADRMRVVVQAAVADLLVQHGHTVQETPDRKAIVVLANGPAASA